MYVLSKIRWGQHAPLPDDSPEELAPAAILDPQAARAIMTTVAQRGDADVARRLRGELPERDEHGTDGRRKREMSRVPNPVVLEKGEPRVTNSPCPRSTVLRVRSEERHEVEDSVRRRREPVCGAAGSPARHSRASAAAAARRPSSSAAAASASSPSPRRTAGGQLRRRRGHVDIATKCSSTWVRADAGRRRSAQWSAPSHVSGMWTSLPKDTWIDGAVPDARHWCGTPRGT